MTPPKEIWIEDVGTNDERVAVLPCKDSAKYLLATPLLEHAERLREALESVLAKHPFMDSREHYGLAAARAALEACKEGE